MGRDGRKTKEEFVPPAIPIHTLLAIAFLQNRIGMREDDGHSFGFALKRHSKDTVRIQQNYAVLTEVQQ